MFEATGLKVLIASPADVEPGRTAIVSAIHEWNRLHAEANGVLLLPVRWELDVFPATGDRPQAIVNEQIVDTCDILVGAFWTRLGTPTGVSESGTVEEIERVEAAGKPVMLYFCTKQPKDDHDPVELERLNTFRQGVQSRGLYASWSTPRGLEQRIGSDLLLRVRDLVDRGALTVRGAIQAAASPSVSTALEDYRLSLLRTAIEFETRWMGSRSAQLPDIEVWKWEMTRISQTLSEFAGEVAAYLGDPDAALVGDLQTLAGQASTLSSHRFGIDGGRSVQAFRDGADLLYANLRELVTPPWSAYLVTRLPADDHQRKEAK